MIDKKLKDKIKFKMIPKITSIQDMMGAQDDMDDPRK